MKDINYLLYSYEENQFWFVLNLKNRLVDAECTKENFYFFKVIHFYLKKNSVETC